MTTSSELVRIESSRNKLRTKGVNLGIALNTDKLDAIADKYDAIVNHGVVAAEVREGETYTIEAGYYAEGTVAGVAGGGEYRLQTKTVTPTKAQQGITSDEGFYGLSTVTLEPIPEIYQDVSSVTAEANEVLATKLYVTSDGTLTPGTMSNNGKITANIDGLSVTSYSIPEGYHNGEGTVSLDNSIELALAEI